MVCRKDNAVGHPGNVPSDNASFADRRYSKTAVVVVTNLSNNAEGTMPAEEIAKIVVDRVRKSQN